MASVNKVLILGNVAADPEVRYLPNGDPVANVRVATTETWKDRSTGEKRESTEWHRLVFHRKLAEIVRDYVKKGASIYVEGRIRTRKWKDKEGQDRYTTEIEVTEMQMLGRGGSAKPENSQPEKASESGQQKPQRNPGEDDDDPPLF